MMLEGRRVDALGHYLQRTGQTVDVGHSELDEYARVTLRTQPDPDSSFGVVVPYGVAVLSTVLGSLLYAHHTNVASALLVWAMACAVVGSIVLLVRLGYRLRAVAGSARILTVGFFAHSGSADDPADIYVGQVEVVDQGAHRLRGRLFLARRSTGHRFERGTEIAVRYIPGKPESIQLARRSPLAVGRVAAAGRSSTPVQT